MGCLPHWELVDRPNSQCFRVTERNGDGKRGSAKSAACSARQTLEVNHFTDSEKNPVND